jgi:hypothetical protein
MTKSKSMIAAMVLLIGGTAQAVEKKTKTPEQACQGQALASIASGWPNVLSGHFEIILKGQRCLVFLQAPSAISEGKRAAWLIDGKNGELLSEFYWRGIQGWRSWPVQLPWRQVSDGRVCLERVHGQG